MVSQTFLLLVGLLIVSVTITSLASTIAKTIEKKAERSESEYKKLFAGQFETYIEDFAAIRIKKGLIDANIKVEYLEKDIEKLNQEIKRQRQNIKYLENSKNREEKYSDFISIQELAYNTRLISIRKAVLVLDVPIEIRNNLLELTKTGNIFSRPTSSLL